jgi:hypothetical protein
MNQKNKQKKPLNDKLKTSHKILRFLATILGIFLLGLIFLARWMIGAVIISDWKIRIRSGPEIIDEIVLFPLIYLLGGIVVIAIIFFWRNRTLRQGWSNLKDNKQSIRNFLIAFSLFALTIIPFSIPQESLSVDQGLVTYLLIGTIGVLLLFYGIYDSTDWLTSFVSRIYHFLVELKPVYFLLICFGVVLILTNIFSWLCFQHKPHIDDTIAQLFNARIFAHGKLYASAPSFPEFFDRNHMIIDSGKWYSQYPPFHPALLAFGVLVGTPWLINPMLGALVVIVFYYLGKELFDEKTGRISAILGTLSPFLLFMSSEYMNHASALLLLSCFILFFFRMIRKHSFASALLAGIFLGLAVNIRPLTALAISTPLIIYSFYLFARKPRTYLPRLSLMTIASVILVGFLLYYNYLTNGNPLTFGYTARWGSDHGLGFGHSGWGPAHTPLRGLLSTWEDINALNRFLFEWPIPSLFFVALLFASRQTNLKDYLLLSIITTPVIAYFFYWYHGILFGPRWEYETLGALVLLSARGIQGFPDFIQNQLKLSIPREKIIYGLKKFLLLCLFFSLIISIPTLARYYNKGFLTTRVPVIDTVKKLKIKNAVVAVPKVFYASVFNGNQIDLKSEVVYIRDLPPLKPILRTIYPDRTFFRAMRDSFYEISVPPYPESPLYEALKTQSEFTKQLTEFKYQTIFWPLTKGWEEFRPLMLDSSIKIVSLREFYIDIYGKKHKLDDYLPALCFWIFDDRNDHLQIFSFMDDAQSYIAAGYKFTLKYITPDKLGGIYEIDRVKGDEEIVK